MIQKGETRGCEVSCLRASEVTQGHFCTFYWSKKSQGQLKFTEGEIVLLMGWEDRQTALGLHSSGRGHCNCLYNLPRAWSLHACKQAPGPWHWWRRQQPPGPKADETAQVRATPAKIQGECMDPGGQYLNPVQSAQLF